MVVNGAGARFEFPLALDMYKYTVEGLAEHEAMDAAAAAVGSGPSSPPPTLHAPLGSPAYAYTLRGIVVHSGTAFAGHYYSYIQV